MSLIWIVLFDVSCKSFHERVLFRVVDTSFPILLGLPFLVSHNPVIDWKDRKMTIWKYGKSATFDLVEPNFEKSFSHQSADFDRVLEVSSELTPMPRSFECNPNEWVNAANDPMSKKLRAIPATEC